MLLHQTYVFIVNISNIFIQKSLDNSWLMKIKIVVYLKSNKKSTLWNMNKSQTIKNHSKYYFDINK